MKRIFFYVSIMSGIIFLSLTASAQQNSTAKLPEAKGNKIQPASDSKLPVVAPATDEKALHNTATKTSSVPAEAKLVKMGDANPPAQLPAVQQLPATNKLKPPTKPIN